MTQIDPKTASVSAMKEWDDTEKTVKGLTYTALALFGVEYVTLLMGVTTFIRPLTGLNILAHLVGLILIILMYVDSWNLDSYIAFFTVFNAAPAVLELTVLFFVSKFSFVKY